jgi:hypothetical protein
LLAVTGRRLALLGVLAVVPKASMSTVAGCRVAGPCGWIATYGNFSWCGLCAGPAQRLEGSGCAVRGWRAEPL